MFKTPVYSYPVNQVLADIASTTTITNSTPLLFHGGQKRLDDYAVPLGLLHRPRSNEPYISHENVGILPDSKFDELFDKISTEKHGSVNKTKSNKNKKSGKQTKRNI